LSIVGFEILVSRNPFLTLIVTGVPGVGKTTVLREVSKILEERRVKHLVLNFGDFMLVAGKRLGLVEHRDQIRHLPLRRQLELQEEAAKAIVEEASSKLDENGVLLVDTHAVIKTSTGYWPGLPFGVVSVLKPDSIVVVESKPEEILARQVRDKSRYRADMSDIEIIKELLEIARSAAIASAVLVASSVYIVYNVEGDPSIAARKIVELIEKLR